MVCSHSSRLRRGPGLASTAITPPTPQEPGDPWLKRADLLVFEILGTDPFCEGLLPTLLDARERLLVPGGAIMPCGIEVHAVLVHSPELLRLNAVGASVDGLDLSALNSLSHRTRAVRILELPHSYLHKPMTVVRLELDAEEPPVASGQSERQVRIEQSAHAHAILVWFTARLHHGRTDLDVSTAPGEGGLMRGHSWGQCVHYLPAGGVELRRGERVGLHAKWTANGLVVSLEQHEPAARLQAAPGTTANTTRDILLGKAGNSASLVQVRRGSGGEGATANSTPINLPPTYGTEA